MNDRYEPQSASPLTTADEDRLDDETGANHGIRRPSGWADTSMRSELCAGSTRKSPEYLSRPRSWLKRLSSTSNNLRLRHSKPFIQCGSHPGSPASKIRVAILSSWLNLFLILVPAGIAAAELRAPPAIVFSINALAIIPLANILAFATQCVANELGDMIGALLNFSLGNLVEIVIFCVALSHGEVRVVQGALVGSILVNLLLVLGTAILAGALSSQYMTYDSKKAQSLACLLLLSVFSVLVPSAAHYSIRDTNGGKRAVLIISRASAFVLLGVYATYLAFIMSSRRDQMLLNDADPLSSGRGTPIHRRSHSAIDGPVRIARFRDDIEHTPPVEVSEKVYDSVSDNAVAGLRSTRASTDEERRMKCKSDEFSDHGESLYNEHGYFAASGKPMASQHVTSRVSTFSSLDNYPAQQTPTSPHPSVGVLGRKVAVALLVAASLLVAVCANYLVGTIAELTSDKKHGGILSEAFIGLIILPVVGNAAEHMTAITVAMKGKFDLALGVSLGSAVQVALFISPVIVIIGWVTGKEMTLYFGLFETVVLVGSGILVSFLVWNGRTNYLEGTMLCACYAMIGIAAALIP